MDIHQFKIFMAVWETGSFSQAARKVYLTQPTVSGHIQSLEEQAGARLFNRDGRKITPTKAGELLYPYARQILRLQTQASRDLSLFLDSEKGSLEIGGSNIPGQYILPVLLGRFKKNHPDIQLMLRIGDTASIIDAVASGELELGMVGAVLYKKALSFKACFDDELVLVIPPGHPLADRKEVIPADLRHEIFIVREKGSGTRFAAARALESTGEFNPNQLKIIAEMGSTEAIRQAVKAGLGCAILSKRAVEDDVRHGLIRSPELKGVDMHRQFYLVHHEKRSLSPLALAFKKVIMKISSD